MGVDDGSNQYCNRITCGGEILPECANGAVRRPMFDEYSDEPISICRAWYCDCTTVHDVGDSFWTVPTIPHLTKQIKSTYDYKMPPNGDPLTSTQIEDAGLDLFSCSECSLDCKHNAEADALCQNCDKNCPVEVSPFRTGTQCDQAFWIGEFRLDVDPNIAWLEKFDEFEHLLVQDLAYFLSTDTKHVSIWQIKPDGTKTVVYFRYLFDTDIDEQTQIVGGDVMAVAKKEIEDPKSTASRGFIMQSTDSAYGYTFCVPTKEECDPSKQISILPIFYICTGASFGFMFVFIVIYRCATRGKRQRAYEAKVREVRQAQLRLMEHHNKARRVGMRDVSKNRAHKIHKAHKAVEKEQKKELKARAKEEKKLNKMNEEQGKNAHLDVAGSVAGRRGSHSSGRRGSAHSHHSHQDSQVELENYRRYSQQQQQQKDISRGYAKSDVGISAYKPPQNRPQQAQSVFVQKTRPVASSVHSRSADPAANLPAGWKVYYNNDGIPYYYNATTGQTTWRHPAQ